MGNSSRQQRRAIGRSHTNGRQAAGGPAMDEVRRLSEAEGEANGEIHKQAVVKLSSGRHFVVGFPMNPPLTDDELFNIMWWFAGSFRAQLSTIRDSPVA